MTRDHASLQRRPFLTPIWLTVLGAVIAAAVLAGAVWVWATADSTVVVVIRHAEKAAGAGDDPPLTAAGEARAVALSRMFGSSGVTHIDAIYVSKALRNRMTAAPLAAKLGLTPIVAPSEARVLARRVLHENTGGRVLVVGHSDTVMAIVAALSDTDDLPPLPDDDYSRMYIVSVPRIGRANVLRLSY